MIASSSPIVAVDVGNSGAKLGLFEAISADAPLPIPARTLTIDPLTEDLDAIGPWLGRRRVEACGWYIASVNRPASSRLIDWLRPRATQPPPWLVASTDLDLDIRIPRPDMAGIDRLVDALAANRLRTPGRAAVVADLGSAPTVDLIDAGGAYRGGSILAGAGLIARALHAYTDMLPLLDVREAAAAAPLGDNTIDAIRSGLFWGVVGAVRELIAQLPKALPAEQRAPLDVFVTGGGGEDVARALGPEVRHVAHLTLAGIALAACARSARGNEIGPSA